MIQVITPDSFIKGGHYLKQAFVRISPGRGEIVLSSLLLDMVGYKKGMSIKFYLDHDGPILLVGLGLRGEGFNVSVSKGRGRIYSTALLRLIESTLNTSILEAISIPVEAIPRIYNEERLYMLYSDKLKQPETATQGETLSVLYDGKTYTIKAFKSKIRAYWVRSFYSTTEEAKRRNKVWYDKIKAFSLEMELGIDFNKIEKSVQKSVIQNSKS